MKKGVHELSTAAFNARMTAAWIRVAINCKTEVADLLPGLLAEANSLADNIAKVFKKLAGEDKK